MKREAGIVVSTVLGVTKVVVVIVTKVVFIVTALDLICPVFLMPCRGHRSLPSPSAWVVTTLSLIEPVFLMPCRGHRSLPSSSAWVGIVEGMDVVAKVVDPLCRQRSVPH